MKTLLIDSELNVAVLTSEKSEAGQETFTTQKQLMALATNWPMEKLVAVWNRQPGAKQVKRFKDRKTGVARIWETIQSLSQPVGPQAANVVPRKKKSKTAVTSAAEPTTAHNGSKKAAVLELLRRNGGATSAELMTATGWQAHSVRGFLSGQLGKKMGIAVASAKREDGTRVYSIS